MADPIPSRPPIRTPRPSEYVIKSIPLAILQSGLALVCAVALLIVGVILMLHGERQWALVALGVGMLGAVAGLFAASRGEIPKS